MFSNLFEERDKKVSQLIKLGDCLGRSLRENVSLFSLNGNENKVTYLTEKNKLITGSYKIGEDVVLSNIEINDTSIFEDNEVYDSFVSEKVQSLLESIHYSEYNSADESFSDLLNLWENRLKLESLQAQLYHKSKSLHEKTNIIRTDEFQKLLEVTPQLTEFLSENFDKIHTIPEIKNAVNLSNVVSTSFNFPKLSYADLADNKTYTLKEGISAPIYELICRQELVKRELLESKKQFDHIWASNASMRKLSGMIFESDEKLVSALANALRDIPYLALASKKSLFETFTSCLSQVDGIGVSEKDIQRFSSKIFELKKEVKEMFIEMLNEKYGVNIQNLQEYPSFKSLVNTQVVIFETLSRLAPKSTVLKSVLSEIASSMKGKTGVDSIDVNDYLKEVFKESGYDEILEATKSVDKYTKVDFKKVSKDLGDMKKVMGSLKSKVDANRDQEYSDNENVNQYELEADADKEEKAKGEEKPEELAQPKFGKADSPQNTEMSPQDAAGVQPGPEVVDAAPPVGETEAAEGDMPPKAETVGEKEVVDDLTEFEAMIADLSTELGNKGQKKEDEKEGE